MMQLHCITPRHILDKLNYRRDVFANERLTRCRRELRQIALMNFQLVKLPNGNQIAVFPDA